MIAGWSLLESHLRRAEIRNLARWPWGLHRSRISANAATGKLKFIKKPFETMAKRMTAHRLLRGRSSPGRGPAANN